MVEDGVEIGARISNKDWGEGDGVGTARVKVRVKVRVKAAHQVRDGCNCTA